MSDGGHFEDRPAFGCHHRRVGALSSVLSRIGVRHEDLWLPKTSNSYISMVQSAKDRLRNNVSEPLDRACAGCILAKRKVRPHLIIVAGVFRKNAPKVIFVEHDHVVRALVPRRPDQALN
jgi:hypothetical protein